MIGGSEQHEIREQAKAFCSILADLYGSSLDRLDLWDRIGSALETSLAKTFGDDLEHFASLCLEHVKAEAARVAASESFANWLLDVGQRPPEWRNAFLTHVRSHHYAVIVHGRAKWKEVLAQRK